MLSDDGRSVTTTDDDGGTLLRGLNGRVEESLRTLGELRELEDTRRALRRCKNTQFKTAFRTYPFHRMVLDSRTVSLKSSRLLGPASRPIQLSGIPSASVATPVWEHINTGKFCSSSKHSR